VPYNHASTPIERRQAIIIERDGRESFGNESNFVSKLDADNWQAEEGLEGVV